MAQSQNAYKFSLFDSYDYGTSAPKLDPVYEPEVKTQKKKKKVQSNKVTAAQKKATYASFLSSAKVISIVFVVFSLISIAMFLNVKMDETATRINAVQNEITIAKSENIRLESALEGMVSIDKVEDYAEQQLGMVKLEDYRITYFNSGEDNHVVVSGGKSYNNNSLSGKIEKLREYIF